MINRAGLISTLNTAPSFVEGTKMTRITSRFLIRPALAILLSVGGMSSNLEAQSNPGIFVSGDVSPNYPGGFIWNSSNLRVGTFNNVGSIEVEGFRIDTVSYTHLTLPTTPYV